MRLTIVSGHEKALSHHESDHITFCEDGKTLSIGIGPDDDNDQYNCGKIWVIINKEDEKGTKVYLNDRHGKNIETIFVLGKDHVCLVDFEQDDCPECGGMSTTS
jgi:aerobic-type carbon monoxide dehydrogenase small subunit (CoxS/CutS family)